MPKILSAAMRSNLLVLVLFIAGTLTAQNYSKNEPPVQQTAVDCYTRNLDKGDGALRRGEAKTALQFFNEAKKCPEAQGNLRRQSDLETRIARCEEQLGINKNTTSESQKAEEIANSIRRRSFFNELPSAPKNYRYIPSREYTLNMSENCYESMVKEGERAFQLKYWSNAAAIFRAAKNCPDADQSARHFLSNRINQCVVASENELIAPAQEASRQARQAIAANLADDAQELLQTTDRSLAFRLADFANQYVAPDNNSDCIQAMFDAWYYQNTEDSKHQTDELYHPVFCYELTNALGDNTQIKFGQQPDGSQWLWAFVPNDGDLFVWEMPSMQLIQSYSTGESTGYKGFDLSPYNDLLFWSTNFFELRRGTRVHRIPVPSISNWCFSANGDEFFYENVANQKIYAVNVREVFAQQMGRKGAKSALSQFPVVPREMLSGVPSGLLAMQFVDGKFWLGYRDRVEVLSKAEPGKEWKRDVIAFRDVTIPETVLQNELKLELYPKEGFAVLASTQGVWSVPIVQELDSTIVAQETRKFESMVPIAVSPLARQLAFEHTGTFPHPGFWLMDARTGDTLLHQKILPYTGFDVLKGTFSPDARWVATATSEGDIKVWALKDAPTVWTSQLAHAPDDLPQFSPNGERLFVPYRDTLAVLNTGKHDQPEYFWKNQTYALRGASDHWALVQVSPDSMEARHLDNGKILKFPFSNPNGISWRYGFDSKGEKLMAYQTDLNSVEVRSLKTGARIASKVFEGGIIGELQFIPDSDDLLVVLNQSKGEHENASSSVRIWSPLRINEKPRALRLLDYPVQAVAVQGTGSLAAFSNGVDIRVFDLKNIENEVLKIRAMKDERIKSIAFRPYSGQLAAAYSSGRVIFWQYPTGQASLQLKAVPRSVVMGNEKNSPVIGFSQNGNLLHVALTDGRLIAYALDPSYIQEVAQAGNRKLQSFGVEHIVEYELESALYYPGNFERLAESDDEPLLRSFFRHFGGQALESNNINQVRDYCERAYYLYERLDGNTQAIWRQETQEMFEDYARKLLLRGSINEAAGVITFIKATFDNDQVLLNAHIALLRNDCAGASKLYSNYLLSNENGVSYTYETRRKFEQATIELAQLRDYELLDPSQLDCFCGTVSRSGLFYDLCPEQSNYTSSFLSFSDQARWGIYEKREAAANTRRFAIQVKLLEEAFQKAKSLAAQNPSMGQIWLETVRLDLAHAHREWAVFEQNSPKAFEHFQSAAKGLDDIGIFQKLPDTSRLSLLSSIELLWGKKLLNSGRSTEAVKVLSSGIGHTQNLIKTVSASDPTLLSNYFNNLATPLYTYLCTALLLEGKPEEARQSYEEANHLMPYSLHPLYMGNVSVYENNDIEAFLEYGSISGPNEAAIALFELERLAEKFPEQKAYIREFIPRLSAALSSKNPKLTNEEMEYRLACMKRDFYAARLQYDSAVVWSKTVLEKISLCLKTAKEPEKWFGSWLDEHINTSYYILMAGKNKPDAINASLLTSERAVNYLAQEVNLNFYYGNRELLEANIAHALMLRDAPGDRARAIQIYEKFIENNVDFRGYDNLELIAKDIRDLRAAGAAWPDLPELERLLQADE